MALTIDQLAGVFETALADWVESVESESEAARHGESPEAAEAFRWMSERHRIPGEVQMLLRGVSFAVAMAVHAGVNGELPTGFSR